MQNEKDLKVKTGLSVRQKGGLSLLYAVALAAAGLFIFVLLAPPAKQRPAPLSKKTGAIKPDIVFAQAAKTSKAAIKPKTAHLAFVGDVMCHEQQLEAARNGDTYDFLPNFQYMRSFLEKPDFVAANLETVLAGDQNGRRYIGYPAFNSPDVLVDALKAAGIDFLNTANNHAWDYSQAGARRTIKTLDRLRMPFSGTLASPADSTWGNIQTINGISVGFLAFTQSTNALPHDSLLYIVNRFDGKRLKKQAETLRAKGARLLVCSLHFGKEYEEKPDLFQEQAVKTALEAGVDIVVGHHPHVVQAVEIFESKSGFTDKAVVFYSLGNFFAHQLSENSIAGVLAGARYTENSGGRLMLDKITLLPTFNFLCDAFNGRYRVVPYPFFDYPIAQDLSKKGCLDEKQIAKIKNSYDKTRQRLLSRISDEEIARYVELSDLKFKGLDFIFLQEAAKNREAVLAARRGILKK